MSNGETIQLQLESDRDLVRVRRAVANEAATIGFGGLDRTRLVTAASELGRNMLAYAGRGTVRLERLAAGGRRGLRVVFEDAGPGIADLARAQSDGYSTSRGLGLGLGGAKRLVDEFDIQSTPGSGTRVVIARWRR